ncbi:MAG: NAD-dependent epimerase/dehydratase family protein [Myxococcota bacterium]|jgi:UDP-glucose 4-epimerase
MRIIVTGGAGFIASNIVDGLVAAGHQVAVVDSLVTGKRSNLNPRAEFHQLDIRSAECAEFIRSFRPDFVDHHAAQIDVRKSVADPAFDAQTNVVGMINVIQASLEAGVKKMVFSSSGGAMYGEQEIFPAPESHPCRPASPYGLTKQIGELYLEWYARTYGLKYVALRYANIYGPRQDPLGEAGVVAIFTGRMLEGKSVTIFGDGGQTRDFVFVGDVVRANMAALESGHTGSVNIGTGMETSVNEVYRVLAEATGYRAPAIYEPQRPGEQRRSVIDPAHAVNAIGWRPQVGFAEGIKRTVAWARG